MELAMCTTQTVRNLLNILYIFIRHIDVEGIPQKYHEKTFLALTHD